MVGSQGPGPAASLRPWSRVESTNLVEYGANLRAAGCPAETVCDILVRELRRRQDSLLDRAQREESPDDFWATGERRRSLREEVRRRRVTARDRMEQTLQEISCRAVPDEFDDAETAMLLEVVAGFAGPEAPRQLVHLLGVAGLRKDRWGEIPSDLLLPEERDLVHRDRATVQKQLEALFPGGQLEELKLRLHMFIEHRLFKAQSPLDSLGLSGAEWREFCRTERRTRKDLLEEALGFADLLQEDVSRPDPSTINPDLQKLLGPERYARYERGNDGVYQETEGLAREHALPDGAAEQARTLMQRWRREVQAGRDLWDRDEDRARPVLNAQRERVRQELEALLAKVPEVRRRKVIDGWIRNMFEAEWNKP